MLQNIAPSFPLHATQQYVGLMFFTAVFVYYSWKCLKPPLAILMGYCLWSSITWALSPFGGEVTWVPPGLDEKTMYASTQTALMIVLFVAMSIKLPKWIFWSLINLWVIVTIPYIWYHGAGLENGYTFTSALLVCALPITLPILWPFVLVTAIYFAGATTIGCLGIVILSYYWKFWWKYKWYSIAAGIVGILVIERVLPGGGLSSSNGRMPAWGAFIDAWWNSMPRMLGTGYGSFEWIGPFLKNPTNQAFQWVHNDFLQMMFEGGLVGLALLIYATAWVIGRVWKDERTRSLALGLLVCMLTYYPLHFVSSLLMCIYVCKVATSEESVGDLYQLPKIIRRRHR